MDTYSLGTRYDARGEMGVLRNLTTGDVFEFPKKDGPRIVDMLADEFPECEGCETRVGVCSDCGNCENCSWDDCESCNRCEECGEPIEDCVCANCEICGDPEDECCCSEDSGD